jgi:hypothetical protein
VRYVGSSANGGDSPGVQAQIVRLRLRTAATNGHVHPPDDMSMEDDGGMILTGENRRSRGKKRNLSQFHFAQWRAMLQIQRNPSTTDTEHRTEPVQ